METSTGIAIKCKRNMVRCNMWITCKPWHSKARPSIEKTTPIFLSIVEQKFDHYELHQITYFMLPYYLFSHDTTHVKS
jgi:hypothetical protein